MTTSAIFIFLAAYATAVAAPGPGLAALIARVMARGLSGIGPYLAGFAIGDLIWFTAAVTGLAAIAAAFQPLITLVRYAGAAYLLYIAYCLIRAQPNGGGEGDPVDRPVGGRFRDFTSSFMLTMGNPKPIVFFMALLPSVLDVRRLDFRTDVMLAGLMAVTLVTILGAYALVAARTRRFFRSRKTMRALNVGSGAVMVGAAVVIATR